MKTKTWKIGEYAKGGVITTQIDGDNIIIIGKDWDYSQGTNRGSSQKNAKEWCRTTINTKVSHSRGDAFMYLTDITTSGYADKILKWFEDNGVEFANSFW